MPAPRKLTDADVVKIRRRVESGEQLSVLAEEFGVDRKTVRRRLDALELAEREEAERKPRNRLKRQIARERRKLEQRDREVAANTVKAAVTERERGRRSTKSNPYYDWLDTRRNLGGRAYTEATGLVRIRTPDGKNRLWVERADVEQRIEEGWILD